MTQNVSFYMYFLYLQQIRFHPKCHLRPSCIHMTTWGPDSPLFLLFFNFKDCMMVTNVWFLIFSVIYFNRLMGIYRVGLSSGYLKSLVLSFLLFLFFSFFFFLFYCSFSFLYLFFLSRGPFSSGASGHCPLMPPSRYGTDQNDTKPLKDDL